MEGQTDSSEFYFLIRMRKAKVLYEVKALNFEQKSKED